MTYKLRPMYGIKESFFGPAAYREAEFYQSTHPNNPAQSLAVGDSIDHPTIEGFEKTIRPQPGTKQELMGAGVVAYAQAFQKFAAEQKETPEPDPEPGPEPPVTENTSTQNETPAPVVTEPEETEQNVDNTTSNNEDNGENNE